jgi:dipeptidyl-peptidase-4
MLAMRALRVLLLAVPAVLAAQAPAKPTVAQFMSPASPLELTTAKKADRIAWMVYDRGMRNVYTAAAPAFTPVRLTNFLKDDGVDLTNVVLSDDGTVAVFVRGSGPNRDDWIANPSHDPDGGERAIWAVQTIGNTAPWKLAVGAGPALSPDGKSVLYVREGQIYRARVTGFPGATPMDRGEVPFIKAFGSNSQPRWSPDGSKIAFVSTRASHSYIALYDVKTRTVTYVAPGVDFDANPTWSEDSKRLLFTRRPGTPFGQQTHLGGGGIGFPQGSAFSGGVVQGRGGRGNGTVGGVTNLSIATPQSGGNLCGRGGGAAAAPGGDGRGGGGRGGRGGGRGANVDTTAAQPGVAPPGLCTATFTGGYTLSLMVTDVATPGDAREVWHNQPNDREVTALNNIRWTGDHIVYQYIPPNDEYERYYSLNIADKGARPVQITTTNGLIEDATSISLSPDGKTFYYCTNASDIEKRHIWAVPVAGGTPKQISTGDGIETHPNPLASGKQIAVLYFDAKTPASIGIVSSDGGKARTIFPTLGKDFPTDAHVVPEVVHTKAADGLDISNTLFLPKDLKPGEKRPAMIFVHGGPVRQMLPGYHYMQFYHWAYGYNQWLQSQGYIVLSINFRGGIGYGRSFRNAPGTNQRGNSEYQDLHRRCRPRRRASLHADARHRERRVQIVRDLGDQRMEVASVPRARRRRPQRRLRADDRTRAIAACA